MAIRGKGLFFLSAVKRFKENIQSFSFFFFIVRKVKSGICNVFKIIKNYFTLIYFANKKWKDGFTEKFHFFTKKTPLIYFILIGSLFSWINVSTEMKCQEIKHSNIGINDSNFSTIESVFPSIIWGRSLYGNSKVSFTIHYPSSICTYFIKIHDEYSSIPKNKCLAATKQARRSSISNRTKRCSELLGNHERMAEKTIPLNYINNINDVIKSYKSNRMTYLIITKEVTLINQDPVLNSATARLAQSMRETEDQLIRDMLEATASITNCTGGTNGDNPTEMVRSDIDGVVAALQNANGEFISEMIGGENKFGTGPVRDCYFGLSSTNMIGQFENVGGFINKAQYPNDKGVNSSEWCSIGNIRFFLSSRGSVTNNSSLLGADIYNNFIVAQESYGTVDLSGSSVNFIYHPAGWGDDPCELRQTCGFRFGFASRITNDSWIINLRATLA